MSLFIMIFGFLTLVLIVINILIVRKIIKINFVWHKRIAYIILVTGFLHGLLVFLYYGEDIISVKYLAFGGLFTYLLLIIQVLIGRQIIKVGINAHRVLGYIILLLAMAHATLVILFKNGIISF